MFKREFIYDFGLAQDDAKSEISALSLKENDRVLCIASAGEIPLELLVNSDESVVIDAVDTDASQIYLSRLKLIASLHFDRMQAAQFLGYMPAQEKDRTVWFQQIAPELTESELKFWRNHLSILKYGPVNLGKYETYIRRFSSLGRLLLGGRKKLIGLFEAKNIEEQKSYFDGVLRVGLLKNLFNIMFHPKFYKQRGISEQGLIHWQDQHLGRKFYNQFRDFCTNTPVRENWMLQFVLFNRVLFEESLPDYLQPKGRARLPEASERLHFREESVNESMNRRDAGYYNKFALSNVSDWLSAEDFTELLQIIAQKSGTETRGLIRYIHSARVTDSDLPEILGFDWEGGEKLLAKDRFPFYKLIPFRFRNNDKI